MYKHVNVNSSLVKGAGRSTTCIRCTKKYISLHYYKSVAIPIVIHLTELARISHGLFNSFTHILIVKFTKTQKSAKVIDKPIRSFDFPKIITPKSTSIQPTVVLQKKKLIYL